MTREELEALLVQVRECSELSAAEEKTALAAGQLLRAADLADEQTFLAGLNEKLSTRLAQLQGTGHVHAHG